MSGDHTSMGVMSGWQWSTWTCQCWMSLTTHLPTPVRQKSESGRRKWTNLSDARLTFMRTPRCSISLIWGQCTDTVIHQDNQSTILLEKNGKGLSTSRRTRHINIRYSFVKDRIAANDVSVAYCWTGDMVADAFTKPLQGTLSRKFCDYIMNTDPHTNSASDHRSVLITNPSI
jgi:hypothetical protein